MRCESGIIHHVSSPFSSADGCGQRECFNRGRCIEGQCKCPRGFYGQRCQYGEWLVFCILAALVVPLKYSGPASVLLVIIVLVLRGASRCLSSFFSLFLLFFFRSLRIFMPSAVFFSLLFLLFCSLFLLSSPLSPLLSSLSSDVKKNLLH